MIFRIVSIEWDEQELWYVEDERGASIECQDRSNARAFANECNLLVGANPALTANQIFLQALRIRYA